MAIHNSTSEDRLAEILKSIDVTDVDVIERIYESQLLWDLELLDGQTLLVGLPRSSRISTAVGCVLILVIGDNVKDRQASKKGKLMSDDVEKNDIEFEDESNPEDLSRTSKISRVESVNWIPMFVVFNFMLFLTSDFRNILQ